MMTTKETFKLADSIYRFCIREDCKPSETEREVYNTIISANLTEEAENKLREWFRV